MLRTEDVYEFVRSSFLTEKKNHAWTIAFHRTYLGTRYHGHCKGSDETPVFHVWWQKRGDNMNIQQGMVSSGIVSKLNTAQQKEQQDKQKVICHCHLNEAIHTSRCYCVNGCSGKRMRLKGR